MISYTCDHCGKPITGDDVVYKLAPLNDWDEPMRVNHLHWKCIPKWGRN